MQSSYKLITRELAEYAAELISHQKDYDKRLYYILERLYKTYADQKVLNAICMQLIKGNQTGISCFKWYEKAVKQELKIAQLYEYYMMSIDGRSCERHCRELYICILCTEILWMSKKQRFCMQIF